ncbi:MAG: hypothetical protein H0X16_12840 [Chloroflexi bacterium]|nr:hypothetical protein [Chloroflexota bacterium]
MTVPQLTQAARAEVRSVLGRAGLPDDPNHFIELVKDAVRTVVLVRHALDPTALTELEVRELREIGLNPVTDTEGSREATRSATAKMTAIFADSLTVEDAAERMRLNQSRLRQMLLDRSLYGIKADGEWRVPAFQFSGERQVRNLGSVLRATPRNLHPVELFNWLVRPNPALRIDGRPVAPLAWLESGGDPGPVAAIGAEL